MKLLFFILIGFSIIACNAKLEIIDKEKIENLCRLVSDKDIVVSNAAKDELCWIVIYLGGLTNKYSAEGSKLALSWIGKNVDFKCRFYIMFPDEYSVAIKNKVNSTVLTYSDPKCSSFGERPPQVEETEDRMFSGLVLAALSRINKTQQALESEPNRKR